MTQPIVYLNITSWLDSQDAVNVEDTLVDVEWKVNKEEMWSQSRLLRTS
jgi:hypothetical protein